VNWLLARNREFLFSGLYKKMSQLLFCCCIRLSEVYYWCVNAINCTGKNMSDGLLYALGEADANMYLCSKELRPCEQISSFCFYSIFVKFAIVSTVTFLPVLPVTVSFLNLSTFFPLPYTAVNSTLLCSSE